MFGWSHNMLITYLVLVLAASAVHASNEFQPARRGHVNLKRMVKKRDIPALVPVIGAGQDPAENPPVTSTTAAASVTTSDATATLSSSITASSTGASGTPNLVNSLLSDIVSNQHRPIQYLLLTRYIHGTGAFDHFSEHILNPIIHFEQFIGVVHRNHFKQLYVHYRSTNDATTLCGSYPNLFSY
jgi:hypothetical protein